MNESKSIKSIFKGFFFRIFGRVERKLHKISEIISPSTYREVYEAVGVTRILGKEWDILDYKEISNNLKPITGISEMKRIELKRR